MDNNFIFGALIPLVCFFLGYAYGLFSKNK